MPAASTKDELLAIFDNEYSRLTKLLNELSESDPDQATADDPTTIKGIIAHRTHWMNMFFTWYEDGLAGRGVHIPAKGYKWNQLKEYNQTLYEKGDKADWDELVKAFHESAEKLLAFIQNHTDDELYATKKYAWTNTWTLGRWLEASSASHFRSATKYIRKVLRDNKV